MMREKSFPSLAWRTLWTLACVLFAAAAYADSLIGVNWLSYQNEHRQLVVIDPATGALLGGHVITLDGIMVQQPVALATDPTDGVLYALLTIADWQGEELVTLDPVTGVATDIGNTGQRIRSMTFKPDGTLLGITSPYDPYSTPVKFFTIDKTTGASTEVCEPTGSDDYVIAYNSDDSQLYYATGTYGAKVFQTLDESTCAATNIPGYTVYGDGAVTALLYDATPHTFLAATGGYLATIDPAGEVSGIGQLVFADDTPGTIRGFAWTADTFTFGDVATYGSFDPDTIPGGGSTTLTLNVVNNGSTPVTGVQGRVGTRGILDMYGVSGDASCVDSGYEVVCTFGDLAVGATETVYISFTADIPSDSSHADIAIWATENEYDTNPADNRVHIGIDRGEEFCTGGFQLTSELLSGEASPEPGYSGTWTFRITAQNCTEGALENVKIQGGTNGWGDYIGETASSGTTSVRTKRGAEVVTWWLNLERGAEATLDVTVSGAISRRSACSPDVSMPVFGSIKYLSGIWSATHTSFGEVETGPVSIVVQCPRL